MLRVNCKIELDRITEWAREQGIDAELKSALAALDRPDTDCELYTDYMPRCFTWVLRRNEKFICNGSIRFFQGAWYVHGMETER
jgi:hypothetical protein